MTDVYKFSETEMLLFFLMLVRMTAFVVSWPVFGVPNMPQQLKILFGFVLAILLFGSVSKDSVEIASLDQNLMLLAAREALIGLIVGFLGRLFFFAFRVAGEMMSQAMGLSAAHLFNPALGGQSTSLEQFYVVLASLFYLGFNGHHHLLQALVETFRVAPLASMSLNVSHFIGMGEMVQKIVELGLKFSAPVVISIMMVNLVLGVVGKTVPQLNVLVTSFPINIMIGLFLMMVTLPVLFDQMNEYLNQSTVEIFKFVRAF